MSTPENAHTPGTAEVREGYAYKPEWDYLDPIDSPADRRFIIAALDKAAIIADRIVDDEGDGYDWQACVAVATAIRAAGEGTP